MVARNIKEWRKKRRMTQTDLANKSGLTAITINRIENGRQARAANLQAIATALECEVSDFYFQESTDSFREAVSILAALDEAQLARALGAIVAIQNAGEREIPAKNKKSVG